jgi:hypothetical protein
MPIEVVANKVHGGAGRDDPDPEQPSIVQPFHLFFHFGVGRGCVGSLLARVPSRHQPSSSDFSSCRRYRHRMLRGRYRDFLYSPGMIQRRAPRKEGRYEKRLPLRSPTLPRPARRQRDLKRIAN